MTRSRHQAAIFVSIAMFGATLLDELLVSTRACATNCLWLRVLHLGRGAILRASLKLKPEAFRSQKASWRGPKLGVRSFSSSFSVGS